MLARRAIRALLPLIITSAAFAQHEHHAMTLDDYRAFVASISVHGPVLPADTSAPNPEATKSISITPTSFKFSPSSFSVNQGDVVTLTISVPSNDPSTIGHGLLMETYVENGINVPRGQSKSVTFTASTPGTFGFVCTQPTCGSGHSNMFGTMIVAAIQNPAPAIMSISPGSGSTSGGTEFTITGTNFTNASVTIGGAAATNVMTASSTTITGTAPAHAAGIADVKVTNGDGQSATLTNGFTFVVPAPSVASISPATGPTSGGTTVTINGANFQSGASVTIGGVAATNVTFVSATQLMAKTPLGPATEEVSLPLDVVVRNSDGKSATLAGAFTYSVPPLAISAVTPNVGNTIGGTVINISGAGFTSAINTQIFVGGVAATNVQVVDAVTLRATVPAHAAGSADVRVVASSAVTLANGFTYETVPPKRRAARH